MAKIKTFKQWQYYQFGNDINTWPDTDGRLYEDGYAYYLEKILGRIPTIKEIKEYGHINLLTSE